MKMILKTVIKKIVFALVFVIVGMLIPFIILKSVRTHYIITDQTEISFVIQKEETERAIALLDSMNVKYEIFVKIPMKYEQKIFELLVTTQDTIRK